MAYQERHNRFTRAWFKIVLWRERHISERTFVIILALAVGIIGGLAAQLLKFLIHTISSALTTRVSLTSANWIYLILPMIGILITVLFVKYVVKDNISHGVTRVLYAISKRKSRLKKKNMWASLISSSMTIGFGGSVGAEGPIVFTGAAIGSNLGQAFRLSPKILMILVGCGAAAGIAGIFRAPIAGMLFTLEVLMIDLTGTTIMPLLLSSIAGGTVAYIMEGYGSEFFFMQSEPYYTRKIPYTILLGIFTGFVSLYFTLVMTQMENIFGKIRHIWLKVLTGGTLLALLIFLFPPLFGEGYGAISNLLNGSPASILDGTLFYPDKSNPWSIAIFIGCIVLTKAFATSATNGAGGVGGTFAPSLFVGAMTGFLFAFMFNQFWPNIGISDKNFALLGMAGVMSGVMHAPLMSIFLTAEMTGGYDLFLPLLIVSTLAYMTVRIFQPYSIYSMRLARKGQLFTHEKDKAVLSLLKTDSVVEKDFKSVTPEMTLKEVVDIISRSKRNLFPVVDFEGNFKGVVLLDDIRNIMFRSDLYHKMHVSRFMSTPPARIEITMPMEEVMKIFDDTQAWNLPVVDGEKYVGFVSKSKIFSSYRALLRHYTDDE